MESSISEPAASATMWPPLAKYAQPLQGNALSIPAEMDKAKVHNPPDVQQQAKTRQQQMIINLRILKSEILAVEQIVSFYEMARIALTSSRWPSVRGYELKAAEWSSNVNHWTGVQQLRWNIGITWAHCFDLKYFSWPLADYEVRGENVNVKASPIWNRGIFPWSHEWEITMWPGCKGDSAHVYTQKHNILSAIDPRLYWANRKQQPAKPIETMVTDVLMVHSFDGKLHPADAPPGYAGMIIKWIRSCAVSCCQFVTVID